MSFTEDELRAFNSILEQRLAAHQSNVEQMLDLRIQNLRRDFEQHLIALQQEVIRTLAQKLAEQQGALNGALMPVEQAPRFEAIEVQTDLPWDDLLAIFGKALDERLTTLKDSLQLMVQETIQETMQAADKDGEQQAVASLSVPASQEYVSLSPQSSSGNLTTLQEVFNSIERLEHIMESMQMAMTNNHALLANRLFHHQQLSQERAHPAQQPQSLATPNKHPNGAVPHIVPTEQDGQ